MALFTEPSHHPHSLFFEKEIGACKSNLIGLLSSEIQGSFNQLPSADYTFELLCLTFYMGLKKYPQILILV